MSSFQDLGVFVQNNPEAEAQRSYAHDALNYKTTEREREPGLTPLSFCLRFIVNEKLLNLEKTTSSVLSVLLLIYEDYSVNL